MAVELGNPKKRVKHCSRVSPQNSATQSLFSCHAPSCGARELETSGLVASERENKGTAAALPVWTCEGPHRDKRLKPHAADSMQSLLAPFWSVCTVMICHGRLRGGCVVRTQMQTNEVELNFKEK